jgi:acetyltransferase-like isoleucine patch superfamily enzyme
MLKSFFGIKSRKFRASKDARGNEIRYSGTATLGINVRFRGTNNLLIVSSEARVGKVEITFDCNQGFVEIGKGRKGLTPFSGKVRVGQESSVQIGDFCSTTSPVIISAVEGTTVTLGNDCMLASDVQLRSDDGHPIFEVSTGERINISQSIKVGNHVWLGLGVVVLGGVTIGDGSVLGARSVATKDIPNNVIAVGTPAKVVRTDIAWERPHLSLKKPFYKLDASSVKKSEYWNMTS